jgi:hypothetical protein
LTVEEAQNHSWCTTSTSIHENATIGRAESETNLAHGGAFYGNGTYAPGGSESRVPKDERERTDRSSNVYELADAVREAPSRVRKHHELLQKLSWLGRLNTLHRLRKILSR